MIKTAVFFFTLLCALTAHSLSGTAYMDRFNTFRNWYQYLPLRPTPEFLEFVKGTTPLSNKLRDKWLYELARTKDWSAYNTYFQPTSDINLFCDAQIAKFNLGLKEQALEASIPVWLTAESRPAACNTLFDLLLKSGAINEQLITRRIALALDKRNVHLTNYLLKLYKPAHSKEIQSLASIQQNSANIEHLPTGELNDLFYLYGLKRMMSLNMDKALRFWEHSKRGKKLTEPQRQAFIAHVALYKAMRNSEDTQAWFNQVKPAHYNDVLLEWQIRSALKRQDWKQVSVLINNSKNKDSPCWQYWLARSLEEQGKKPEAAAIYQPLAQSRQYYGFLASIRLNKTPNVANEKHSTNLSQLKPYQSIINEIKSFYQAKKIGDASRLLNDFISELPKEEASALVYWVDTGLQWHAKSVFLSNNEVLNNQLTLRFPLAYENTVRQFARKYAVAPEFIYAIIRQESGFREDVKSSVGALGLMQVMPSTAKVIAKTSRIAYSNPNDLYRSQKNINIGIAYLQQLTKRFRNHPVLIAAAYNAGPHQVVYWLRNHPPKEIDMWIETLPWQETRNYLKNVMAFYVVYQYRLNQKPDLRMILQPL